MGELKTKALISFAVTAKLICAFVFAYAKCCFSHDAANFILTLGDPPLIVWLLTSFLNIYYIFYAFEYRLTCSSFVFI